MDSDEAAVVQALEDRAQMAVQMARLNAPNPVSTDFTAIQELQRNEKFRAIANVLVASPAFMKFISFAGRGDVRDAAGKIWNHPDLKGLLFFQLGWMVLVWVFGAWWRALGEGILRSLAIRLVTTLVLFTGLLGIVPAGVLGHPYLELIRLGIENF